MLPLDLRKLLPLSGVIGLRSIACDNKFADQTNISASLDRNICYYSYEETRPSNRIPPVSKQTKTFHQISVYWLCQHKRQTLICAVYEQITKGQVKRCIDLEDISLFVRNASNYCHLKIFKIKKNGKTSISYKFPIPIKGLQ